MALNFWSWEIVLGAIIPIALLLGAKTFDSEALLFTGSAMTVVGLVMHRWHTTMIGFLTPLTQDPAITYPITPSYTPSLVEWSVVVGILGAVMLALTLGLRYLPAFDPAPAEHAVAGTD
jgi:Ni/Fe-hydrogenase subunit HybB-like protein